MDLTGFSREQIQALLDLLIVGMYADGNLTSAEDARIEKMLDALQFPSDYDREQFSDAAFTRARGQTGSPARIRAYVQQLASHFTTPGIRRQAFDILEDLITSDGGVTAEENQLLAATRDVFQL